MRRERGWKTTEFWLAAHWTALAGAAVTAAFASPPKTLAEAMVLVPAVWLTVKFAGAIVNNYAENRWRLKAGAEPQEPARTIGFGRHVDPERQYQEEDCDRG